MSGIIQLSEFNLDGYNVFCLDLVIMTVEVCCAYSILSGSHSCWYM